MLEVAGGILLAIVILFLLPVILRLAVIAVPVLLAVAVIVVWATVFSGG